MNYLAKNQRYTLLKLNKEFSTLDDINTDILTKVYKDPLTVKKIPEDTPEDERIFIYKWINISDVEEVKFDEKEETFTYIKATAKCEFSTRRVLDQSSGELLPKEKRLNTANTDVIFINTNEGIYAILFSSEFYELRRIKRLIGEKNIEPLSSIHQTDSDLFHWLFYKRIMEEFDLNDDITLDNINGFTGTVLSEENQFEGTSIQTAELIITKAFITNGYPINSIKIDLQMNLATINFFLNEISDGKELITVVQKNSSLYTMLNNEEIEYVIPIYVFFYLIPEIVELYRKQEAEFLSKSKTNFLTEIGIEVIKTIMAKNSIDIEDIK
ncbi:TPA: hypothetical protein QFG14_000250 [Enterococcus faecium]|uniref:hypothetical protein n=1 Tax=Enterococcus faecium TaxID=1352 RepID=UPI00198E2D20|nr:hypothetical protein [Enterococcus faecium]EGP5667524.1 hypothetical protein [Enterococcus faecium]MBC9710297.1 hypothetical protein [Enterococcus sp.]MBX9061245.1 hypothetical protein [Enterococcus faecium]